MPINSIGSSAKLRNGAGVKLRGSDKVTQGLAITRPLTPNERLEVGADLLHQVDLVVERQQRELPGENYCVATNIATHVEYDLAKEYVKGVTPKSFDPMFAY